jgi:hypothetical protein
MKNQNVPFCSPPRTKIFQANRDFVTKYLKDLDRISDARFSEIKKYGKVEFNGKKFDGTRDQYIAQVKRELTSRMLSQDNGGLKALSAELTAVTKENDQPYDITDVELHGEEIGLVSVTGDEEKQAQTLAALQKIASSGKAQFVTISCYSNDEKGLEQGIYYSSYGRVLNFRWFLKDGKPYESDQPLPAAKCAISFFPMSFKKLIIKPKVIPAQ